MYIDMKPPPWKIYHPNILKWPETPCSLCFCAAEPAFHRWKLLRAMASKLRVPPRGPVDRATEKGGLRPRRMTGMSSRCPSVRWWREHIPWSALKQHCVGQLLHTTSADIQSAESIKCWYKLTALRLGMHRDETWQNDLGGWTKETWSAEQNPQKNSLTVQPIVVRDASHPSVESSPPQTQSQGLQTYPQMVGTNPTGSHPNHTRNGGSWAFHPMISSI